MLEKRFVAVPPQLFTASGTANGVIKVVYSGFFKVKQQIIIKSNSQGPTTDLEIKRITDINTIEIGPKGKIDSRSDLSMYTTVDNAVIFANEQHRPIIPQEEVIRAVYEEEPVVAYRVIGVDQNGNTVNWSEDGLVPQEFDDVQLTRDLDEDITEAQFFLRGTEVRDLELTYNIAKSLIRVRKVGP
jgi:hypothetical protein